VRTLDDRDPAPAARPRRGSEDRRAHAAS
jgi:hypothetical protein